MAKRLRTRVLRRTLWTLGLLGLLVALTLGGLALRLAHGPINLSFAVERLEKGLTPSDQSFRIDIDSAYLAWEGWSEGLHLQAVAIRVMRGDGTELANLPSISLTLDPVRLAFGEFVPTTIIVREPSLVLLREPNGQISVALDRETPDDEGFVPSLLGALSRGPQDGPSLDRLAEIRLIAGNLTIIDSALARTWRANDLQARVWRTETGVRGELDFDLAVEDREFRFRGRISHVLDTGATTARLLFAGLDPALFESAEGPLQALGWFRMPLSGNVDFQIDGNQRLTGGRLEMSGGEGIIAIPEAYAAPLEVESMSAVAQVSADGSRVTFGPMRIVFAGPTLTLEGTLSQGEQRSTFDGRARFKNLPTDEIGRYWPRNLAGKARWWVTENISDGVVPELTVDVRMGIDREAGAELELENLLGRFSFEGISVRFLPYLPPVRQVDGRSEIYETGMRFWATSGTLNEARVTGAEAYIDWTEIDDAVMTLSVDADGPLQRILQVIDRPPLGYATALGANPSAVEGGARVRFEAQLPMRRDLELPEVDIEVRAQLRQVAWRRGLFGEDVTDGNFELRIDKEGMTVAGPARIADTPVDLGWQEFFSEARDVQRRLVLNAEVTNRLLSELGADLGPLFTGSAESDITITGRRDGTNRVEATFDLKDAGLTLPFIEVTKARGRPGTARLTAVLAGERPQALPRIEIASEDVMLSANATFHDDGVTIETLNVERLEAGRTRISARVEGDAAGNKTIRIEGEALDLAPALRADEESAPDEEEADEASPASLALEARLERLYMSTDDHPIRGVRASARYDGTFIRRFDLTGTPDGGSMLTVVLVPDGEGQRFHASTAQGGALWRALGVTDIIVGGDLTIRAARDKVSVGTPFVGRAEMRDFEVVGVPELQRLSVFNGDDEGVPSRITFDQFIAPFRFREGVIDIRSGRTNGPRVGLTFAGRIDLSGSSVNLDGTAVPAYRLNSLLGRIPGLGRVFVGERGSGVLAARWRARGALHDPEFDVNTLSVLTPGLTRYLLGIFRDDGGQPDFDAPPIPPDLDSPPAMGP